MPHRFNVHDVLVDLEGHPVISDTKAIHIVTGKGFKQYSVKFNTKSWRVFSGLLSINNYIRP